MQFNVVALSMQLLSKRTCIKELVYSKQCFLFKCHLFTVMSLLCLHMCSFKGLHVGCVLIVYSSLSLSISLTRLRQWPRIRGPLLVAPPPLQEISLQALSSKHTQQLLQLLLPTPQPKANQLKEFHLTSCLHLQGQRCRSHLNSKSLPPHTYPHQGTGTHVYNATCTML